MNERTTSHSGFIYAFFVNLLLQFKWLLLAAVMLALHFWKDIPIALFWTALCFWLLLSLVVTWFVAWAAGCQTPPGSGTKCTSQHLQMSGYTDASQKL